MCSDSMGSIQAAVKRLLAARWITCSEYVEKGVNKKRYSITDEGRREFMDWLQIPADLSNGKNMELSKFLFMGLAPAGKRLELIDGIIQNLESELSGLLALWDSIQRDGAGNKGQALDEWMKDPEYLEGIIKATQNPNVLENANAIGYYQLYTLRYGIDNLQFNVNWFKTLRKTIEDGEQVFFPVQNNGG
jgi:DNA-binding PadR family transcriptional regulator